MFISSKILKHTPGLIFALGLVVKGDDIAWLDGIFEGENNRVDIGVD